MQPDALTLFGALRGAPLARVRDIIASTLFRRSSRSFSSFLSRSATSIFCSSASFLALRSCSSRSIRCFSSSSLRRRSSSSRWAASCTKEGIGK